MKTSINKYLLLLISACLLFTACKVLKATWEIPKAIVGVPVAVGESLGIINEKEESQEKVVNGKVVKVDSNGEIIPPSSTGRKVNVGYLIWWVAVFTTIALGVRYYVKKRHE
tara:strand:- start:164 stop:499 length:336 start_codon:yes stop_codon:yes gene_type:complete